MRFSGGIFIALLISLNALAQPGQNEIFFNEQEPAEVLSVGEEDLQDFLDNPVPIDRVELKKKEGFATRNFKVFLEVFKYFAHFANEFEREKDKSYASIGDFVFKLQRKLNRKSGPVMYLYAEVRRLTTADEDLYFKYQSAGAGLRIDAFADEDQDSKHTLSFFVMPLYGEQRKFYTPEGLTTLKSDMIIRANLGAAYEFEKFESGTEGGFQVFVQPQLIEWGTYRIYAESYLKFKILKSSDKLGKRIKIQQVSLVPKVIYWKATESAGIREIWDLDLSSSLYAFLNLEFHFRL